jgi:hypothetical protein
MIFNHENNIICFISWMIQKENAVYNKIRYLNWRNRPLIYRQKLKLKELILRVINLFIEITKYSSDSEVKNIEQIWKHISFVSYVWTCIIHKMDILTHKHMTSKWISLTHKHTTSKWISLTHKHTTSHFTSLVQPLQYKVVGLN